MAMKREHIIYIVVGVLVVVGAISYLLITSLSGCALCGSPVGSSYLSQLSQVANNYSLAADVGAGIAVSGPYGNLPKQISGTVWYVDGKPEVLYIGGEFCPYCAVTRWGLILALMRFGNFSSLDYMESSPKDVYPDTATFSFANYSYSSSLVHFDAFEIYGREEQNISNPGFTQADEALYYKYGGGIPFIDFANQSYQSGAPVSPGVLAGENWDQVLSQMNDPSSPTAQAIIGIANEFTAAICRSSQSLNSTAPACRQGYLGNLQP